MEYPLCIHKATPRNDCMRCFPDFSTTSETFLKLVQPEKGKILALWEEERLAGFALLQGCRRGPAMDFFRKRGYEALWSSINMELALADFSLEKLRIPSAPAEACFRFAEPRDRKGLLAAVGEAGLEGQENRPAANGWERSLCGEPKMPERAKSRIQKKNRSSKQPGGDGKGFVNLFKGCRVWDRVP